MAGRARALRRLVRRVPDPSPHGRSRRAAPAARRDGRGRGALSQGHGIRRSVLVQYVRFLKGAVRGDFGESVRHGEPAMHLVLERLPATFELAGAGLLLALCLAIPAGIISAVKRNTPIDYVSTVVALMGQAMPTFWLGIMLILVFSVWLNWLPSSGRGDLRHLILPAVTLGLFTTARVTRLTRSGMLEVLGQDYIRTARAKGVSEQPVVWKHALKNASIPIVTIVGIELGTLLGGSVITETIFAWPRGWPPRGAGHLQPRLSRGAGGGLHPREHLRLSELSRGRRLHVARSADQVPLMPPPNGILPSRCGRPSPSRSGSGSSRSGGSRAAARRSSGWVVVVVVFAGFFAPWLTPFDPLEQDINQRLKEPGWQTAAGRIHVLGTDHLGRDILSRVIFGSRIALVVGVGRADLGGARYGHRPRRRLLRRQGGRLLHAAGRHPAAFPFILLAIAVIAVLGPILLNIIIVIGVSSWVVYARWSAARSSRPRARVRPGGHRARQPRRARGRPPRPAQRLHAVARGRHARHGARHRHRIRAVLPRGGRPAAHADLGRHARGWPRVPLDGVAWGDLPGLRHLRDRARDQPAGRRPPRHDWTRASTSGGR